MADVTFVGRDAVLERLTAALVAAGAGQGSTVLVGGEAGIGKTSLVTELAGRAREQDWRVHTGHCIDLIGAGVPYLPIVEALGTLRDPPPGEPDPQARLFADIRTLLDGLAARTPVLLVLEDLHWADASTLDLFTFLAHSVSDMRVLMVATFRSDEAGSGPRLQRLATGLLRARKANAVDLGPLTEHDVAALLDATTAGRVPPVLTRTIFERSEGNPFFAEELCAAAMRGETELPHMLRDVLLLRLADLDARGADRAAGRRRRRPRRALRAAGRGGPVRRGRRCRRPCGPPSRRTCSCRTRTRHVPVPARPAGRGGVPHAVAGRARGTARAAGRGAARSVRPATTGLAAGELAHHWAAAGRPAEALVESVRAARQRGGGRPGRSEALRARRAGPRAVVAGARRRTSWPGVDLPALLEWAAELSYLTGDGPRAVELIRRALDLIDEARRARTGGSAARAARAATCCRPGEREEGLAAFRRAVDLVPPTAAVGGTGPGAGRAGQRAAALRPLRGVPRRLRGGGRRRRGGRRPTLGPAGAGRPRPTTCATSVTSTRGWPGLYEACERSAKQPRPAGPPAAARRSSPTP